jgi:hypothetical protein
MVLTVAHWLVICSARSGRQFRWFGLHWLTWLAVCAVGGPFLHYSIVTIKDYAAYGWPLEYYVKNSQFACRFHWPALIGDLAVWLTVLASTAFVAERWIRRVEQRVFLQKSAFFLLSLVVATMIWILNADWPREPEWYDYYAWLLGIAAVAYAFIVVIFEVFILRRWKGFPKGSLLVGALAGAPVWFALSPLPLEPRLVIGLSLVAAAFAATVLDAGRRDLTHRDKGAQRFVNSAYGEHIATLPMWVVGIIGIGGGLVLIYA